MKKLFLVEARVRTSYYMQDDEKISDENCVVWASSCKEAEDMVEKFWSDATSEYSVYYSATAVATEAMGSPDD